MACRGELLRRNCLVVLIGLLVTLVTGGVSPARAAPATGHTYVVNSTLDEPDGDPLSGLCFSAPSGKCTLRAAIMAAYYAAGPNTIILPAGTYTLTRPGYDMAALVGDLDIAHDLTLQGAGAGATIVDGNGAVTHDRVFHALSSTQSVTMTELTIRNGQSLSNTAGTIGGGGLLMEGSGHLSLSDVVFTGDTALTGGGLYISGTSQVLLSNVNFEGNTASGQGGGLDAEGGSQLRLSSAIFAGNTAQGCGGLNADLGYQGGSIELDHVIVRANTAFDTGGVCAFLNLSIGAGFATIDLHDSQVYSNTATAPGGGFTVSGPATDSWSIERSEIYSNTASEGGGIYTVVPLTVSDSRLHDNNAYYAAGDGGGGIWSFAPLTLTRTTLDANTAAQHGGGVYVFNSNVTIDQSTLSGNSAQSGGGLYAATQFGPLPFLRLTNSTVSGNVVYRPGGATGSADGGGLYIQRVQTELYNTTIANNRVQLSSLHPYPGIGGGLYLTDTSVLTAENSIIANNVRSNEFTVKFDDCFSDGTTGMLSSDLILTDTNCSVSGSSSGLIVGQDPLLGPLQDNGSSTQTQALLPGSPAIDAGFSTGCTGDGGIPISNDQRGAPRPAFGDPDPSCDIGAYELVPEADLSVAKHGSSATALVGAPLTYTIAVTNSGPATATGIVLTDTLPAGVTLNTAVSSQGSCSGTVIVICNLGALASSSKVTVTVAVTTTATGVITNTAAATANEFDPVLANNTASETTAVLHHLYLPLITRVH